MVRKLLPKQKLLILLDGLYADGPTIRNLRSHQMDFMIVIKEGYVLHQVENIKQTSRLKTHSWENNENIVCTVRWVTDLILNGANQDIKVHYLEYEEKDKRSGKTYYSNKWITNIAPKKNKVNQQTKAGRSRWKIENETFNTLKNQGYNLDHNYGYGKKHLSTLFALLMLLAFFIDQLTAALDQTFEKVLIAAKTMRDFRQKVRVLFDLIPTISMNFIYKIIARELILQPPK